MRIFILRHTDVLIIITRKTTSADRTARRHVLPMEVGPFAFI